MKTIWVIEHGCYSDYRVVGVFTSKEKAELVAARITTSSYDQPTVAEWPLDPAVHELSKGYTNWLGEMLKDGTVERMVPWELSGYDLGSNLSLWKRTEAPAYKGKNIQDCLHGTVLAKDQRHAVKIFNERRTQMIANGEWA